MTETDKQLAEAIGRGDKDALRESFELYGDAVFAFLMSRGASRADAEDLVHDTFVQVWKSASQFSGRSSFKAWIFVVARNKLIDKTRQQRPTAAIDDLAEQPDLNAADGFDVTATGDDTKRIGLCLSQLSEDLRNAIRLVYYEDLTIAEAADIECCPVGTLKTRLMHARQRLRHCLKSRD